jgi:hypothetical protein
MANDSAPLGKLAQQPRNAKANVKWLTCSRKHAARAEAKTAARWKTATLCWR